MLRAGARAFLIVLGIVLASVAGLYWLFGPNMATLPKGEFIAESSSPGGEYTVKAYRINGGATTSFWIRGELTHNLKEKRPKNIYWNSDEDTATIIWVDNDTVSINGHELAVPAEVFDYRKRK